MLRPAPKSVIVWQNDEELEYVGALSDIKFACPVCHQHMSCDRDKAGLEVECPSCSRKILVPAPAEGEDSKFMLTASEVRNRPVPQVPVLTESLTGAEVRRKFSSIVAVFVVLLLGFAASGAYIYREQLLELVRRPAPAVASTPSPQPEAATPAQPRTNLAAGTTNLTTPEIPLSPTAGRISGLNFICQRATLTGGSLNLRQGERWPPDVGVTIYLAANRGEDLAGQTISFAADQPGAPRITLRRKDAAQQPITTSFNGGYNLRLEFGPATNGQIPGKIYLCFADGAATCIAGTFEAEIRAPSPARPHRPRRTN